MEEREMEDEEEEVEEKEEDHPDSFVSRVLLNLL